MGDLEKNGKKSSKKNFISSNIFLYEWAMYYWTYLIPILTIASYSLYMMDSIKYFKFTSKTLKQTISVYEETIFSTIKCN